MEIPLDMYRLLIADDEKLERQALRYVIQKGSAAIEEIRDASSGREAIAKAVQFRPEICFLDIKMPGISGIEAARRIKELVPGVRVVFLTAFDYFDYAKEAIRIGVDDFIVKPASDTNVIDVIRRVTEDLDRQRRTHERNERVEQKLDRVATAMAAELSEALGRGFVVPEKLAGYVALREATYDSMVVARISLDYESYPMRIDGDSQKAILRKRCLRMVERLLQDAGWFVVVATAEEGLRAICLLPAGAAPVRTFEEAAKAVRRELAIKMSAALSEVVSGVDRIEEALLQVEETSRRAPAEGPVHCFEELDLLTAGGTSDSTVDALGERGPFEASDTGPRTGGETPFPPEAMEARLLAAILSGDRRSAFSTADDVYRWLGVRAPSVQALARWMNEFFVVVRYSLTRRLPRIRGDGGRLREDLSEAVELEDVRRAIQDHLAALLVASSAAFTCVIPASVRQVQEFIETHYFEDISLGSLAGRVGQSGSYLSRRFKQHAGLTIVEYINRVRIARAKRLLVTGELTVKEASRRVGYADAAYFARVFRQFEGVSPSVYRDRLAAPTKSMR